MGLACTELKKSMKCCLSCCRHRVAPYLALLDPSYIYLLSAAQVRIQSCRELRRACGSYRVLPGIAGAGSQEGAGVQRDFRHLRGDICLRAGATLKPPLPRQFCFSGVWYPPMESSPEQLHLAVCRVLLEYLVSALPLSILSNFGLMSLLSLDFSIHLVRLGVCLITSSTFESTTKGSYPHCQSPLPLSHHDP